MIILTQLYIGLALYVNCINKDWVNLVCHHDIHCTYHNSHQNTSIIIYHAGLKYNLNTIINIFR